MRKILLFGLFVVLIASCSKKTNVEITGAIKDADNTKVYLEQIDVSSRKVIDSTKINKKGEFTFKINVDLPTFYALKFANNEQVTIIATPEEKIEISGKLDDIKNNYWVDGSENSLWIKLLNFQLDRTITLTDSLRKSYQALPQEPAYDKQREEYAKAWEEAINKQINFTRDFIIKHATSPASYYALYQKIGGNLGIMDEIEDLHYFKVVASSLTALYPESQYTKAIMNHLKEISQAIRNQQLAAVINNSESSLPDITLPNTEGKPVSLLSLKDKYIVLDFGLITAKESQEYIKEMKTVYDKFKKQGVEIYMVCLDKNRLLWEEIIKQNKINWICVWDEGGLQSRAAASWNIKNIPANYIINQKKEIVGKNLYGSRLEDRLNTLLKK
ncbi:MULTISPECIES: TlpA disulfide reductase family protein [Butyricimonas]|jgi:peroxiredoxin|uniref:AhpC/TSA family protein n=1 Tax=Butyricimonas hominis TaxID=2763032 RepID=A0ABR7D213_9BACT|nr:MULTISPECIES: TlpA disulfide reductase family protein [Butyricimonas]MBC5621420.1 AhpC/TSA family protein [Butyricimonas hominis]MCB6973987.1 AhpC/TSA family protein [Butyricimonas synergistica]MCG4520670.1 AhpC/TSA family protein [Butyricimonas sp. DFI.6.44]